MNAIRTFVRSVKPKDLCLDYVDATIDDIRTKYTKTWAVLGFTEQDKKRNVLIVLASGNGSLIDIHVWPDELFLPTTLCYGFARVEFPEDDESKTAPSFISFCWKGRNLPIYLRTKYTEFHRVIREHLAATTHFTLTNLEELKNGSFVDHLRHSRHRPRTRSRRFITQEIEFAPEIQKSVMEVRADMEPYNWIVCGYEDNSTSTNRQRLIVLKKGLNGLYGLMGVGGITSVLQDGVTMYIYLRVDLPVRHDTESKTTVSKYVLVTWQSQVEFANTTESFVSSDEEMPRNSGNSAASPSLDALDLELDLEPRVSPPPSSSGMASSSPTPSQVHRVVTAHVHGSEIYRLFPHHVHFVASTLSDISESAIRERIRRAVDNDCMFLRAVCIEASGETRDAICLEMPFDADVKKLKQSIAVHTGIPENQQRIVWIRQTDEFHKDARRVLKAILLSEEGLDDKKLREDLGVGHGDKLHVDDLNNGENSVLAKLFHDINSGTSTISLSAERRHEVQRGVEAREQDLQRILNATKDEIRRKAQDRLVFSKNVMHQLQHVSKEKDKNRRRKFAEKRSGTLEEVVSSASENNNGLEKNDRENSVVRQPSSSLSSGVPKSTSGHADAPREGHGRVRASSEDLASYHSVPTDDGLMMSNLEEKARLLESQTNYLEIPYDSIRILNGKENELGCGKAATVYRGLWMNRNSAAEVAIKVFRYIRLTPHVLGTYTQEVALLRKLKHPNIVLFIGACTNPKLMILTEYCSRKSLNEVIHSAAFKEFPWEYKVRLMLDAARGIQYLHSKRIIHRDIKSHNFLVDDDWRLKVADFGISKVLENDTYAFTQCGTTGWVAPEVLLDEDLGYTFKADNWSFAIVMWEIIADGLDNPFIGMAPVKFYNQTINSGKRPIVPEHVDPEYAQLMTDCWQSNPLDRPHFTEIVERLENMLLNMNASIALPPSFEGGYHHATECI